MIVTKETSQSKTKSIDLETALRNVRDHLTDNPGMLIVNVPRLCAGMEMLPWYMVYQALHDAVEGLGVIVRVWVQGGQTVVVGHGATINNTRAK